MPVSADVLVIGSISKASDAAPEAKFGALNFGGSVPSDASWSHETDEGRDRRPVFVVFPRRCGRACGTPGGRLERAWSRDTDHRRPRPARAADAAAAPAPWTPRVDAQGVIPIGRSAVVPSNGAFANVVLSPHAAGRIKRAFERERFDLIHLQEPAVPVPCMAALLHAEVPLVGTFHAAGAVPLYALAKPVFGFLLDRLNRRIAVSSQARDTAARFFPGNYELISNRAPLPHRASPRSRRNTITFVGRHDRRKGLDVLLRAWPEIHCRTGARLRVIGADPLAVGLLLARLRIDRSSIDVLGSIADAELTADLLSTKLLVAPSLGNESFGMVITRAFACAIPVVASDIAGYRDVVTSEAGVLVAPGQIDALAEAVIGVVANETVREQLGAHARELAASRYSWGRIALRLLAIYAHLLTPATTTELVAA